MPNAPDYSTPQGWGQAGQQMMMNPMTLGGLGLMSGHGFQGMMAGMNGGQAMQKNQHELLQQQARDAYMQNLDPKDPRYQGMNPALVDLSKGTNDPGLLGKALIGKGDQDFNLQYLQRSGAIQHGLKRQDADYQKQLELQQIQNKYDLIQKLTGGNPTGAAGLLGSGQPQPQQPAGGVRQWTPNGGLQ